MSKPRRTRITKQMMHSMRIRSDEILCEECGAIYDLQTGVGLCRYCVDDGTECGAKDGGKSGEEE